MNTGHYKRYTLVGPGGLSCPCCAPQSGKRGAAKARAKMKRQAKRRERIALAREGKAEFLDLLQEIRELLEEMRIDGGYY